MAQATVVPADLEFLDSEQVLQAIEADILVGPVVQLPGSMEERLVPGDWIYVPGYTARGPLCVSWSRRQQLSWALPDEYCGRPEVIPAEGDGWTAIVTEEARMNAFLARIPADC
jgi:hypothetical protein